LPLESNVTESQQHTPSSVPSGLHRLITRSAAGDPGAFREIVEQHQGYAFALAFRIVWDEEDARDIVQDAFIRVWRHLPEYDGRSRFTTWLYTIVTRLAYDRLKKEKRRSESSPARATQSEERDFPDPSALEEEIGNRDLAEKIRAIAGDLPLKQRMVFVLRDVEDRTIEEIGEMLAMSAGSVRTNLCYARQEIRRRMQRMNA
jgi:RNA polymerase sigma-70 factor (ECF subfamily)